MIITHASHPRLHEALVEQRDAHDLPPTPVHDLPAWGDALATIAEEALTQLSDDELRGFGGASKEDRDSMILHYPRLADALAIADALLHYFLQRSR